LGNIEGLEDLQTVEGLNLGSKTEFQVFNFYQSEFSDFFSPILQKLRKLDQLKQNNQNDKSWDNYVSELCVLSLVSFFNG
jgi:hypothetical protein